MSKARTLNPYDMEARIHDLEENGGGGETTDAAKRSDIATEFSATTSYTAGNYVYYEGKLYIFNVDHAAGAWDATDVAEANVTDEVTSNKAAIDALEASVGQKAYGTGVNILTYTKVDPYVAPSDGVVRISCGYSTSSYVGLYSGQELIATVGGLSGNANGAATVPVLKGESLGCVSSGSDLAATFLPYVAAT